ncbi:DUF3267 domain-containing protein [Dyadobacter sp. NIV53]|uniref:DUF3267 domain-containing protein n=1 Tax=Dyadobacter sp. NIV53 TaxID=2861765 RepID=UPI001C88CC08|nr:DUF3267 domain-containing protein [Dyadobacter sp. NIV53]
MTTSLKHHTISARTGNLFSIVLTLILMPVMVLLFALIWKIDTKGIIERSVSNLKYVLIIFIVGVIVHELIHGMTAAWYAGIGWKNIRFGVQWKSFTPYCHSMLPMPVSKYRYVVVMPLIILGMIPYVISLINGSGWFLTTGILFTVTAAGDMIILWMMRKLQGSELIQDHPSEIGFLILNQGKE